MKWVLLDSQATTGTPEWVKTDKAEKTASGGPEGK